MVLCAVEERSPGPPAPLLVTKMTTKPRPPTFQPPNSLCELQMGVYNLLYAYFGIRHNTACPGGGSWWVPSVFDKAAKGASVPNFSRALGRYGIYHRGP